MEVLQGQNEKIPDEANPLRHADRKLGQGSKKRASCRRIMEAHELLDDSAFETPGNADENLKSRYWDHVDAQKLLGVISRLWRKKGAAFELSDLQEAYLDDLDEYISQKNARPLLGDFTLRSILKRKTAVGMKSKEVFVWSVCCEPLLDGILNEELSAHAS